MIQGSTKINWDWKKV